MKDSIPSFKSYLIPLFVVIIIILLIPLVLIPQLGRIRDKNQEVKEASARLESLNRKIDQLSNIDETEESLKFLEMDKAVPSDKRLAPSVVGVRALAEETGLNIVVMKLRPGKVATESVSKAETKSAANSKTNVKNDNELFLTLLLQGGMDKFRDFASKLESAKRLLGVNTFTSRNLGSNTFEFEFEIKAPFSQLKTCPDPNKPCKDIVAEELPVFTSLHQKIYNYILDLAEYTTTNVPPSQTGVENPFKD